MDETNHGKLGNWILQLENKLAAKECAFPNNQTGLCYALNRLEWDPLLQVNYKIDKNTGEINMASLNKLLTALCQAYDGHDRACNTYLKIGHVIKKTQPFVTYHVEVRYLIGDLNWNEVIQNCQVYDTLPEQVQ